MAEETIRFEDEKSKELYIWVSSTYPPESIANCHLLIPECIGVLKGFKQLGLNYKWIDLLMNTFLKCVAIIALS